ncbi:MAG: hypothetical protein ABFR47_09140 [Verrucomicrobiota bacterium]
MKKSRYNLIIAAAILGSVAHADIVHYDYSNNPIGNSADASDLNSYSQGSLYLSTSGASLEQGELEISLSAFVQKKEKSRWATVDLLSGFSLTTEGEIVGTETNFSPAPQQLLSATGKGEPKNFDGYVSLRFDAGDGDFYYGWAKIAGEAYVDPNGKSSSASLNIMGMAFNDTANKSILAGQTITTVIPEPAVVTLVLGFGISLVGAKRIFKRG